MNLDIPKQEKSASSPSSSSGRRQDRFGGLDDSLLGSVKIFGPRVSIVFMRNSFATQRWVGGGNLMKIQMGKGWHFYPAEYAMHLVKTILG